MPTQEEIDAALRNSSYADSFQSLPPLPPAADVDAALRNTGSNYSVNEESLAPTVENASTSQTPVSFQSSRTTPEPEMGDGETTAPPVEPSPAPVAETPKPPAEKPRAPRPAAVAAPAEAAPQSTLSEADQRLLDAYNPSTGGFDATASVPPNVSANGVEDKPLNVSAGTRELRGDAAAADVRQVDMLGDAAESTVARGQAEQAIGAAKQEAGAAGVTNIREAEDSRQARYEESRGAEMAQLAELKQQIGNPPKDTVGLVMGIIGAVAALGGKPQAGQALQALSGAMNQRMKKWQAGIQAGERNLEGLGKVVNSDRIAALDDQQAEKLIHEATIAEFDNAFDVLKRSAKTEAEVREIENAQNLTRKAAVQAELSKRDRAAAAAREREINAKLANAKTQEERDWIANQYGKSGRNINKDMLKMSGEEAKVGSELLGQQKTVAEIGGIDAKAALDKAKAEGKGEGAVWAPKGWTSPPGVTPQIQTKVYDLTEKKAQVANAYDRLIAISEGVKSGKISKMDADIAREVEDIRNGLVSMKTTFTGAGAPTGAEYEQTIATIADPQKFLTRADGYSNLLASRRNLEGSYARVLGDAGFSKGTAGPRPVAGDKKMVTFSDGEQMPLGDSEIAALRKSGSKLKVQGEDE